MELFGNNQEIIQRNAYELGWYDGIHNSPHCPYPEGSKLAEWWQEGYNDGLIVPSKL